MIDSKTAEKEGAIAAAKAMCVAARTAPKTKGMDFMDTGILTGEELERLALAMEEIADAEGMDFLRRDAANVRASQAVVLFAHKNVARGLNEGCRYCGFDDCADCMKKGGRCVYIGIDLGIAMGAAAAVAGDLKVDSRIMFSVGRGAQKMGLFPESCMLFGMPISVSGKSPYFDRK